MLLPCHTDLGRACLGMLGPDDAEPMSWDWVKTRRKKGALNPGISAAGSSLLQQHLLTMCRSLLFVGKSFREQQCEKYNAYNYTDMDGNLLQWVPKYAGVSPRDRCKLFCRARGRSEFKVFEAKVRTLLELRTVGGEDPTCGRTVHTTPSVTFHFPAAGDRWHPVWARDSGHLRPWPVCQGWL